MQELRFETLSRIGELAISGLSADAYAAAVVALVGDPVLARRLMDWLPEAFGLILVGHMGEIGLPRTFKARDHSGEWREIPLSNEPVFARAVEFAAHVYHAGPRHLFSGMAAQSAVVDAVSRALNAGDAIDGATLGPIEMRGIPPGTYDGNVG